MELLTNRTYVRIIIATVGIVDTKREEIKQTLSLEFNLA